MGLLRFILAFSVALMHGGDAHFGNRNLVYGFDAVIFFFMISGFYMTMILNGKYTSVSLFYLNRWLKLLPIYLVIVFILIIISPITPNGGWEVHFAYTLFNYTMLFSDLAFVLDCSTTTLQILTPTLAKQDCSSLLYIPPVWSVSIEILFYAIAPFVIVFGKHYLKRIAALCLISLAWLAASKELSFQEFPWRYNIFLPNAMWFALGSLAYYLKQSSPLNRALPSTFHIQAFFFSAVITASVAYQYFPIPTVFMMRLRLYSYAALLFVALPYLFDFSKNSKVDRFIGNLSYPIYICHLPVLHYAAKHYPAANALLIVIATALVLQLIVGIPVERIRQWVAGRSLGEKFRAVGPTGLFR